MKHTARFRVTLSWRKQPSSCVFALTTGNSQNWHRLLHPCTATVGRARVPPICQNPVCTGGEHVNRGG